MDKRNVTGDIRITGQVKADFPADIIEAYKASNRHTDAQEEKENSREDKRFKIECVTLFFVILLAVVSLVQTKQAIKSTQAAMISATAAQESVRSARDQFHLENRAYLFPGEVEEVLGGYAVIKIPIINTGHVPTKGSHLRINYERMDSSGTVLEDRVYDYETQAEIPPGHDAYFFTVGIPAMPSDDLSQLAKGREGLLLRGRMEYDSGFGIRDTMYLCYDYQSTRGHWRNCSGQSMSIWLNDAPQRNPKDLQPIPAPSR